MGPPRRKQIKRVLRGVGISYQQTSLTEIVEHESGQHDCKPSQLNGPRAEMPHIRVHCLGAREREKGCTEHGESDTWPRVNEVEHGIVGTNGGQDARGLHDTKQAEQADRDEPHEHHWPEDVANEGCSLTLYEEQAHQDCDGDGNDHRRQSGRIDLETFDSAEN